MDKKEASAKKTPNQGEYTVIETMPNGPLMVYGKVFVTHNDNAVAKDGMVTAFCRCGASRNPPFCDGSHRRIGFKG